MKRYEGHRINPAGPQDVIVRGDGPERILSPEPSQKLFNHSPDGFQWGYGGSGPAQLALALLFDVSGDGEEAVRYHQDFKREFVAMWESHWWITEGDIDIWISGTKADYAREK